MDGTVHFLITDKETFDRINGREKKSEIISKSETSDTLICDIQVLERLETWLPGPDPISPFSGLQTVVYRP